jgi:hypothetical protein
VNPANTLLDRHWIPGKIIVEENPTNLKVDSLTTR